MADLKKYIRPEGTDIKNTEYGNLVKGKKATPAYMESASVLVSSKLRKVAREALKQGLVPVTYI